MTDTEQPQPEPAPEPAPEPDNGTPEAPEVNTEGMGDSPEGGAA